jgi:ATP-dependent protease HslVU (ClpYQ) peptidase subunit
MAIGTAGSCRMGDSARAAHWPALDDIAADDRALTLGNAWREIVDNHGDRDRHVWALIAHDRDIYYAGNDGSVICLDASYTALGSGELVALGALWAFERAGAFTPWERVTKAIEAAAEHVAAIRPPFVVVETRAPTS